MANLGGGGGGTGMFSTGGMQQSMQGMNPMSPLQSFLMKNYYGDPASGGGAMQGQAGAAPNFMAYLMQGMQGGGSS